MSDQERPIIDLQDVIKNRVAAGEPVYITGSAPGAAVDSVIAMVADIAEDLGKPAKMIQVVELPSLDD